MSVVGSVGKTDADSWWSASVAQAVLWVCVMQTLHNSVVRGCVLQPGLSAGGVGVQGWGSGMCLPRQAVGSAMNACTAPVEWC